MKTESVLVCGFANSPACSDTDTDGYPDARTRVYAYDAVRRLASRLDQQLALTTYSYDFANRLLSRHYPDSLDDSKRKRDIHVFGAHGLLSR